MGDFDKDAVFFAAKKMEKERKKLEKKITDNFKSDPKTATKLNNELTEIRVQLSGHYAEIIMHDATFADAKDVAQKLWTVQHVFLSALRRSTKVKDSELAAKHRRNLLEKLTEVEKFLEYLINDVEKQMESSALSQSSSGPSASSPFHSSEQILTSQNSVPSFAKLPTSPLSKICYRLYMGLGDVYRYQAEATPPINGKTDLRKAMESYRKAISVLPQEGNPYNQLAVVSQTNEEFLPCVFYYCLAISVNKPFMISKDNYIRLFNHLKKSEDRKKKATASSTNNASDARNSFFIKVVQFQETLLLKSPIPTPSESSIVEIIDSFKSLLSGSGMSEALLIKLIVVCIFSFLNGRKGFKSKEVEILTIPVLSDSRSPNAAFSMCFLMSIINSVMELEILKQLTRGKGRRPKQIRNFGALVLFTEWLLAYRSALFPTTPPRLLQTPTSSDDSDFISDECLDLERNTRKQFWSQVAEIANILSNPTVCPSWISDDVKLAEKNKRMTHIPKDLKEVVTFSPFEPIPRVAAAKKLLEGGSFSSKDSPPPNADELANGQKVIIFKNFVDAATQGEGCPLQVDENGVYSLVNWVEAEAEEEGEDGGIHYMELEDDNVDDFGMNDDAIDEPIPPKPASPALSSTSSNEERIVYQKPLPPPPVALPSVPLSSLHKMSASSPNVKNLPPSVQNLALPFALPQTSNPFWSEQAFTDSYLKSAAADPSTAMENTSVIRSIEAMLAMDDVLTSPTSNPFFQGP